VFAANPKTVVVLLNGGPLAVAWEKEHLPAVLDMFIAGEEGGTPSPTCSSAIYNPGGRLPYTVYESAESGAPMTDTTFTKGFTYMYFEGKPVYPFGHGLSLHHVHVLEPHSFSKAINGSGSLTVRVNVRNSPARWARRRKSRVLYVRDVQASVQAAEARAAGF
jgi:beta-glucosidase